MVKRKNNKIHRFCKTCIKRTIFNLNKVGYLVCSRCGFKIDELKEDRKV